MVVLGFNDLALVLFDLARRALQNLHIDNVISAINAVSLVTTDEHDLWLDPATTNVQVVTELLKPYDAKAMGCYPVSTRINHVTNDDEECSRPVVIADTQDRLFA
jgi:hypothetical protein